MPRLLTLGGTALLSPDGSVPLLGPGKPLALLGYLALATGKSVSREFLLELLWANTDPVHGRQNLRQVLWQVRQVLGDDALSGREEIFLHSRIASDRNEFLAAVESGNLEVAIALYRGPFFPDFASPGGAAFEQWADLERQRLRATFLRAAETVARRLILAGHARECIPLARSVRDLGHAVELGYRLAIDAHLALSDAISAAGDAEALERWATAEEVPLDAASRDALRRARQREAKGDEQSRPTNGGTQLVADLVGREREFAAALAVWEAARRGEPRHLHLVAPAGLGKTRLLHDLRARLIAARGQVRYTRANPGDRAIPGALLGDIAEALAGLPGAMGISRDAAATLVALDPPLSARYNVVPDASTGADVRRRRALALGELIAAAAHEKPFALLIDDVHWADAESLAVLEAVLARIDGIGVMIVTATRPVPDHQLRSERRETLILAPLSTAQIGDLVASLGQFENALQRDNLVRQLASASGGSPLLVLELLQLALEQGLLALSADLWSVAMPEELRAIFTEGEGIRQRLSRLGPDAQKLLRTMAVAGAPLPQQLIAAAAGLEGPATADQLMVLERRGLVQQRSAGWEPTHDEIADTALLLWDDEVANTRRDLAVVLAQAAVSEPVWLPHATRLTAAMGDAATFARLVELELPRVRRQRPRPALDAIIRRFAGEDWTPQFDAAVRRALPWSTSQWPRWIGIAAGVIILLSAVAWFEHRPPPQMLVAIWKSDSGAGVLEINPDEADRRGDLGAHSRPAAPIVGSVAVKDLQSYGDLSRNGDSVLLAAPREGQDSTDNIDIFLVIHGQARPLTNWRKDDVRPRFAPGDSEMVYLTSQWSPATADNNNIAIMNLRSGAVRRVTNSDDIDDSPIQSPDGTRLAFVRNHNDARGRQFCVTTWGGQEEGCHGLTGYRALEVVGWMNPTTAIVIADTLDRRVLLTVNSHTGDSRLLRHDHVAEAMASPDGKYVACLCERDPTVGPRLEVFPVGQPDSGHALNRAEGRETFLLLWQTSVPNDRYLDSLEIRAAGVVEVGTTHTLRYSAANRTGRLAVFDTATIRWSSGDTSVARIDSLTGQLEARRVGKVRIRVTAGGWRSDSTLVLIQPSTARVVFEESWHDLNRNWRTFGAPPGHVASVPGLGPAFINAGDGTFPSGAYSRSAFDPSHGITVEALISTPLTRMSWQQLLVGLHPNADSLDAWDHRTGAPPITSEIDARACIFGYPAGEGGGADSVVTVSAGIRSWGAKAPGSLRQGKPTLMRLSLFADGTCGIALDGVAMQRSRNQLRLDRPTHLWIWGQSVGTQIAVGHLKVWLGDPGGVNWEKLGKQ